MLNKQLYQEVLARLKDASRRKRSELWESHTWMLHRDNAPAHSSLLNTNCLANRQTSVGCHPPYSPDFLLFSKLKTILKGRRFQTIEEIQENAVRELRTVTESALQKEFHQLKKRWENCIASRGDCIEGDST